MLHPTRRTRECCVEGAAAAAAAATLLPAAAAAAPASYHIKSVLMWYKPSQLLYKQ